METSNQRLERLKKTKAQLTARIQKMEAVEKTRERKRETRRKILIGAYFLEKAKQEGTVESLMATMENYVSRDVDKALFQSPPWKTEDTDKET